MKTGAMAMFRGFFALAFLALSAFASELYIAGGAGYKRPITELAELYEKKSGVKVKMMFGNMQQVGTQIKASDKVAFFFGDERFIKKLELNFDEKIHLGAGRLMLVFSKKVPLQASLEALKDASILSIGIPDVKSAIYGIAGSEAIKNGGLSIDSKLKVLQNVPQVSAYLVSGDLDAGFINKTDCLGIKDKVGSFVEIDKKLYSPINIVAVRLKEVNADLKVVQDFASFLSTQEVADIFTRHGL